jgi:hypothetical protein
MAARHFRKGIAVLAVTVVCVADPAAATPASVPDGVDAADYGRAFAYWQAAGLDAQLCPSGPIAIYDEARIQATTLPVADASGALQWVAPIAFTLAPDHPCEWWFGDAYRMLDAVRRCYVVTHEIGHLLGRPDGFAADGDPLGVMGQFAVTPQCAVLLPPPPTSISQPDPMALALIAHRARELAELDALARRWERYDRLVDIRARALERRTRCLRAAAKANTPHARKRARARCRAQVHVPARPAKPHSPRQY